MTLQEKLDALRVEFETNVASPEVLAAIGQSIDEVVNSGLARRALKAGDIAPAFALPDQAGRMVSSQSLLHRGPLVITFYRGVWCSYCNLELQSLQEAMADIRARRACLVAISPQTPNYSRKSQRDNDLAFPILSDRGGRIADAFGLLWTMPEYLRDLHRETGADITSFNGDNSWALPIPGRYIIGQDGTIAYAEIDPDHRRRPEPTDLYPTLDRLASKRRDIKPS